MMEQVSPKQGLLRERPAAAVALWISLADQQLALQHADGSCQLYTVSCARNGAGERNGSGCTPRGLHRVRLKIGDGCPPGAVFRARRPTGELFSPSLAERYPQRDWILTRILWLTGLEPRRNRGGECDTLRRFIYIHGCPDSEPMGVARSHGCIRMRDPDLLELFGRTPTGTLVHIQEGPLASDLELGDG